MRAGRGGGFTFVELVLVIVVASIAAVALIGLFGQSSTTLEANMDVQTAAQLAQERAEEILADRRNPDRGYAYIVDANYPDENPVSGFSGFNRTVSVTEAAGTGIPCPSGATCKTVVVTVSKGTDVRAQVTLLVTNY